MPETITAAEQRAEALAALADTLAVPEETDLTGTIIRDLAEYIGDTAGALGPKAIDEIAYAYLEGAHDAIIRRDTQAEHRRVQGLVRPILAAINS